MLIFFWIRPKTDRTLFRELIKTNGVGPKLALAILSAMSVEQFAYAIEREELSKLVKIPGVGKKTAERLLVELKGSLRMFVKVISLLKANIFLQLQNYAKLKAQQMKRLLHWLRWAINQPMLKNGEKVAKADLSSEQLIREALKAAL